MKGREALRIVSALREAIRSFNPDIVHSHALHANCAALLATISAREPSKPVITTIHSVREGGRIHRGVEKLLYRRSTAIVGVSKAVLAAHGFSATGTAILNGVDDSAFRFNPAGRARVRRSLGISDDMKVLLNVGRLTEAKNHALLISAMKNVAAVSVDCQLLIAGDGPNRQALELHIKELGLQETVTLLGPRQDIPDLLSAADTYVQSSTWEGLPLVLLEAQASGMTIVATSVGGTAEISSQAWRLVEPNDVDGLATAITNAKVSSVVDRDISTRSTWSKPTSRDAMVESWLACYDDVTT